VASLLETQVLQLYPHPFAIKTFSTRKKIVLVIFLSFQLSPGSPGAQTFLTDIVIDGHFAYRYRFAIVNRISRGVSFNPRNPEAEAFVLKWSKLTKAFSHFQIFPPKL